MHLIVTQRSAARVGLLTLGEMLPVLTCMYAWHACMHGMHGMHGMHDLWRDVVRCGEMLPVYSPGRGRSHAWRACMHGMGRDAPCVLTRPRTLVDAPLVTPDMCSRLSCSPRVECAWPRVDRYVMLRHVTLCYGMSRHVTSCYVMLRLATCRGHAYICMYVYMYV